jgi:hypothetical protein
MNFVLKKHCSHRCFESFNHTKGLLKHNGFVWNFVGYNLAIMESIAKIKLKFQDCVPMVLFQIYKGIIFKGVSTFWMTP